MTRVLRGGMWWRRLALLTALAVAVASCGSSGANAEELADEVAPLVEGHDALRDFMFQIEGGLTYGDLLAEWPTTSATVRRSLDDFDIESSDDSNSCDATVYSLGIALAHDEMSGIHDAVGGYIRDDEPEWKIGTAFESAEVAMEALSAMRDDALAPGDQCEEAET